MREGKALLADLATLGPQTVFVRTHNLLTSGDGTPALKWGSTGAYTEDAQGRPHYNWTIVDRIFDTNLERGLKPYVQIGFMPQALSQKPEPYQHHWSPQDGSISTGWAYPPSDYRKWGELGLPVGDPLCRPLWPLRGRAMVLGSLERAEHHVLAGHSRGLPSAP